ncbi:MAG: hypothetical protein EPN14_09605, partial [Gallionella sp.]
MNLFKYLVVGSLLLTACAHPPKRAEPAQPEHAQPESAHPAHPVAPHEPQAEAAPVLPDVELSGELLYEFLLTEIASQRGHTALAVEGSTDMARKTRDPRLAQRATQLAIESGDMGKAVAAFRIWQDVEPASPLVNRMLASVLLRGGKLDEAQAELAKVLKEERADTGRTFLQIYQMVMSYPDKAAALKLVRNLAEPYPDLAEAHWSVAHLAQIAGDRELALDEVRRAGGLRPEWSMAVSLE